MSAPSSQSHAAAGTAPLADPSRRNRTYESSLSTSRWRFNRSSTNLHQGNARIAPTGPNPASTMPTPPAKMERSPSKMSLFNLFSRPNVEKARGHTEVGLDVPAARPQTPPKQTSMISTPKSSLRQNPSPPAQQSIRSRSSQMFRPISMRPASSHPEFGIWEPPPLFQALSQSVKNATVQACVFPPEVLMRSQSQRRQFELLREKMDNVQDLSAISEIATEAKKLEKTHRRFVSNSGQHPTTPELVEKVYALVATGYVLQYARNGPFDRQPEKVLKLAKDSAAFACDLIPGKHWVLQISSHAHNNGAIEPGPKNSLLTRFRSQSSNARKGASHFLLVLESAEEMDAWMTSVRREIDSIGGRNTRPTSTRPSTSTEGTKRSTEAIYPINNNAQRDPDSITTKSAQLDSPPQSQYSGFPNIVASEWEAEDNGRSGSIAESTSEYSSRRGTNRQSIEVSSVASTPVSQHQVQLDQLRRRSRFSFVSNTSLSGANTRNTSPNSSPAPGSPVKEDSSASAESEPLRSAMSLRSFHMNPNNNSTTSRRRSMQPLPVTDEHFPSSEKSPAQRQRHSLFSSTPLTGPELEKWNTAAPVLSPKTTTPSQTSNTSQNVTPHIVTAQSTPLKIQTELINQTPVASPPQAREDSPLKPNVRSYSIPARASTISPPPQNELPPMPTRSAPRQSMIGTLPTDNQQSVRSASSPAPVLRAQQRLSASPRPFFRPLPVRPQTQHGNGSIVVPRRQSSLTPSSAPAPLPLGVNVNRSVTAPVRPPSEAGVSSKGSSITDQTAPRPPQTFHHLSMVQARPDSVSVLAPRRVRAISSMPSFVPGRRSSTVPTSAPRQLQSPPSIDVLREQAIKQRSLSQSMQKELVSRQSMSAIGLPPPAPPPNMPLPSLPPGVAHSLTQTMPPPAPPPNMPLPPPPSMVTSNALST